MVEHKTHTHTDWISAYLPLIVSVQTRNYMFEIAFKRYSVNLHESAGVAGDGLYVYEIGTGRAYANGPGRPK